MWAPEWEFSLFMMIWDAFRSRSFTVKELADVVARDKDQLRVALSRLTHKGWILRLKRGKYLAKPLDRIVASLRLYSTAQNALRKAGIVFPTYIYGSVADFLATEGSDIDLLIVTEGWEEVEQKLSDFHLTFIHPDYIQKPDFLTYTILKRGVPLTSRLEISEADFNPEKLLKEAKILAIGEPVYEPELMDAAGMAAKYVLYRSRVLPPTSTIGAIFELARVEEAYSKAFKVLQAGRVKEVLGMVMEWAMRAQ